MFLCDNQWKFWTFSIISLWNRYFGKRKRSSKNWCTVFKLKALKLKTHHFHTKMPYQKPMLRQKEWWVQRMEFPTTKNGVFPLTTLSFWGFCFSLRTSYKELICCTNNPNSHIRTFFKRWSFIWRCFFPVSILKETKGDFLQNWCFALL